MKPVMWGVAAGSSSAGLCSFFFFFFCQLSSGWWCFHSLRFVELCHAATVTALVISFISSDPVTYAGRRRLPVWLGIYSSRITSLSVLSVATLAAPLNEGRKVLGEYLIWVCLCVLWRARGMQRRLMHGRGPAICVMGVSINNEIILVSEQNIRYKMAGPLCLPPPEGGAVITDTLFMSDSRCLAMQFWPIHYANGMHRPPTSEGKCSTFWRLVGSESRRSRAAIDRFSRFTQKCGICFCCDSLPLLWLY